MPAGSAQTRLIVLRGNSGSGKSTVARALREAYGRGVAWVSQDLIRRTILNEKDRPGGASTGLIDQVARYSLDSGYHVVLDGIFCADRYEPMLAGLSRDHLGLTRFYYLDVSLEETLRRHATRPQAAEFGPDDMRQWYRPGDLLSAGLREQVIPETSTVAETIRLILAGTRLLQAPGRRDGLADCRLPARGHHETEAGE
jgi:predicted kinase